MQDRELVAAIVAGNPDGLAEAYDRYAAPLHTYCRFMLPDPCSPDPAADAVADTFIIATAKLSGLRDPDQLVPWLNAVARNECQRQAGAVGPAGGGDRPAAEGAMPAVSLPAVLRERVLKECADSTPAGRAHRASVTHRAGPFGRKGFPEPVIPSGPPWWHGARRHPRAAAGVAAAAAAIVVAGSVALAIPGGPHRAQGWTAALGGGDFATSSPANGDRSAPSRTPGPATRSPTPAAGRPDADPSRSPAASRPPGPIRSASGTGPSASGTGPSTSPSPSPSPSPTPGTLLAVPKKLTLSAAKGKTASGTFILTAVGGPVDFAITSPNAKVTVSPSSGSLPSAGSWVTVTVTVRSLVAVSVSLSVNPGDLIITVVFTIKA